ncbi:MAG: hypothetical protein ACE5HO_18210 [bacterium]
MYLVQNTKSNQDRLVAGIVTSVILLGGYFALRWSNLPAVKQKTEIYEEINWTKFNPKPERIVEKPKPVKVNKPIKIEKPPEAPKAVERIDLSDLSLPTLSRPTHDAKREIANKSTAKTASKQMKIDLESSGLLAGFDSFKGDAPQKLHLPGRGRGGSGKAKTFALTAKTGTSLESKTSSEYGKSGFSLGAPQTKGGTGEVVKVKLMDVAEMGQGFNDLSPIYRALIEWMKRHPAQFPEVVNRFMEKAPRDLSSVVDFQIGGRSFQMYLTCKVKLYEVRVCLLEGNASTYLIDRGFKEKSSYLRTGSVSRRANGQILAFGTTRRAASNRKTTQFYQVFLSWWESVKPEVQQFL